jgi:hypothetical protein
MYVCAAFPSNAVDAAAKREHTDGATRADKERSKGVNRSWNRYTGSSMRRRMGEKNATPDADADSPWSCRKKAS